MRVEISEFARKELEDAVSYYELEQRGLGLRFQEEIRKTIDRLMIYPNACPIEIGEVRKSFVHKFPYKILYSIQGEIIIVLAISHLHRRPGYWIEQ